TDPVLQPSWRRSGGAGGHDARAQSLGQEAEERPLRAPHLAPFAPLAPAPALRRGLFLLTPRRVDRRDIGLRDRELDAGELLRIEVSTTLQRADELDEVLLITEDVEAHLLDPFLGRQVETPEEQVLVLHLFEGARRPVPWQFAEHDELLAGHDVGIRRG